MPKHKPKPPTEWDLLGMMEIQLKGIMAGRHFLVTEVSTQALSLAVIVGVTTLLGGFIEAVQRLAELRPCVKPVTLRYDPWFEKWGRMRDDGAHPADKIMGPKRTPPKRGRNFPWYRRGYRLLFFDPKSDHITTGSDRKASFSLRIVVTKTGAIFAACLEAIHDEDWANGVPKILLRRRHLTGTFQLRRMWRELGENIRTE